MTAPSRPDRALDRATELIDGGGTVVLVSAIHMLAGKGGMGFDPIEKEDFDRQLDAAKARLAEKGITATTVEGTGRSRPGHHRAGQGDQAQT